MIMCCFSVAFSHVKMGLLFLQRRNKRKKRNDCEVKPEFRKSLDV